MHFIKKSQICFVLIFTAFIGFASQVYAKDMSYQQEYDALVKQSYDMPEDYDFGRLREVFRELPTYDPYGMKPILEFRIIDKTLDVNPEDAEAMLKAYIKKMFALSQAHFRAMASYETLKNEKKVAYHRWMGKGLMTELLHSGSGEGPKKAIDVLTISEEYFVIEPYLERKKTTQGLKKVDGKVYDVIKGPHIKTGEDIEFWFDITHIYGKGLK